MKYLTVNNTRKRENLLTMEFPSSIRHSASSNIHVCKRLGGLTFTNIVYKAAVTKNNLQLKKRIICFCGSARRSRINVVIKVNEIAFSNIEYV